MNKNRILLRIAAYSLGVGIKPNVDIPQNESKKVCEILTESQQLLSRLYGLISNNADDIIRYISNNLKYLFYGLGRCGKSYTKNDKKITIEFQLGIMNPNSIANINIFLRNNLHDFSKSDQRKITYEFNKFVDNNFYIVFILIFEDKQFKRSMKKTFSKELSIEQIDNWCKNYANLFV